MYAFHVNILKQSFEIGRLSWIWNSVKLKLMMKIIKSTNV